MWGRLDELSRLLEARKNLQRKAKAADKMFTQLVNEMNNELKLNRLKEYDNKMEIPKWL